MFLTFAGAYSQCMLPPVILTPLFFSSGPNKSAGSSLKINSPSSMSLVATQPTPRPANNSSLYMSDVYDVVELVPVKVKVC